ncbi:hypothetical protein C343_04920 [Cryptococcus neoformans C23]|uniref:Uncharacterized protein n=2 Tax=Cryptococcus neoformans TaxID=5207 RepID=J9VR91_CRYN9|nr:hypothetical protein CNAG_03570 [Cryptococcus neoformans var. grubii H99]AUB26752.1 hypothetical protein CKF44_03570 [Cryptococcus neoformans var. grubii]OWZ29884.1 hypothetical protein C347_04966 [Cryptococcus neoformans var. grubii AD2-60a]OWZ41758.1 hypothetical protein C343_04920 [Cryptococcus neoformans var. grubii C23]OXC83148.1 hypothetical protein C344_04645 [Cryptococcus neoformans var. grubii AD1-7a]OXG36080.1 hypothetical protein C360_02682 [Cryptococcus neoformans var. grubii Bt|eukprot:XP_012051007.1 hypothetical protein CNAG_03570 [Cryptococcus neoformans var. grubii H99]
MQTSSHHFTSLTEQTNRGSSQPSQSPTIASTSYRPSRDHLWVWSCHPSTQPDAAASTLNESYLLSQMSAYEVAYHNPLFQLDANLPADQQQRNVPMDERFDCSIVSTPINTMPEVQSSQQHETFASIYDWRQSVGPSGSKNTGRARAGARARARVGARERARLRGRIPRQRETKGNKRRLTHPTFASQNNSDICPCPCS